MSHLRDLHAGERRLQKVPGFTPLETEDSASEREAIARALVALPA